MQSCTPWFTQEKYRRVCWSWLCVETLRKQATSVAHLTNLSFEFFTKFSQKIPLNFFYTTVQKSQKWPKTQIKGGPALTLFRAGGGGAHCAPPPPPPGKLSKISQERLEVESWNFLTYQMN